MEKKIILDTNFLVAPFQLSIALFEEIDKKYPQNELYVLDKVLQEAKSIEGGKYKDLVEKLIEKKNIEILETKGKGKVDDLLVEAPDHYVIATNDKELKERLLDHNKEVLIIRSKNHLEVLNRSTVGF